MPLVLYIQDDDDRTCVFKTLRRRNSYLTSAVSCAWYWKGKLREMELEDGNLKMDVNKMMEGVSDNDEGDDKGDEEKSGDDEDEEA